MTAGTFTENTSTAPIDMTLPFHNMRQVLSLHAKTGGRRKFLIHIDGNGEREELSYAEFNARSHQTANLLHDDLGVQRGDRVALLMHTHSETAIMIMACWIIGAAVLPLNPTEDVETLSQTLKQSKPVILLAHTDYLSTAETITKGVSNLRGIMTVSGQMTDKYPHFNDWVKNLSNTYLGDGGAVKSDDDTLKAVNETMAALDDDALLQTTTDVGVMALTQRNLLRAAWGISQQQTVTGGQCVFSTIPLVNVQSVVFGLVLPLLVSASTVISRDVDISMFWRRLVTERVSIAILNPHTLTMLTQQGHADNDAGHGVLGDNVNRRGLNRFRHLICAGDGLTIRQLQEFERLFGYPVMVSSSPQDIGLPVTMMPYNLTWEEHEARSIYDGRIGIGTALPAVELAILSSDGAALPENTPGKLMVRMTSTSDWVDMGVEAVYRTHVDGQVYFYI